MLPSQNARRDGCDRHKCSWWSHARHWLAWLLALFLLGVAIATIVVLVNLHAIVGATGSTGATGATGRRGFPGPTGATGESANSSIPIIPYGSGDAVPVPIGISSFAVGFGSAQDATTGVVSTFRAPRNGTLQNLFVAIEVINATETYLLQWSATVFLTTRAADGPTPLPPAVIPTALTTAGALACPPTPPGPCEIIDQESNRVAQVDVPAGVEVILVFAFANAADHPLDVLIAGGVEFV